MWHTITLAQIKLSWHFLELLACFIVHPLFALKPSLVMLAAKDAQTIQPRQLTSKQEDLVLAALSTNK